MWSTESLLRTRRAPCRRPTVSRRAHRSRRNRLHIIGRPASRRRRGGGEGKESPGNEAGPHPRIHSGRECLGKYAAAGECRVAERFRTVVERCEVLLFRALFLLYW